MKNLLKLAALALSLLIVLSTTTAEAGRWRSRGAVSSSASGAWHGNYYHTMWGQPVALVVPPTAEYQTNYSWGVPSVRVERINHQFGPGQAGPYFGGQGFYPTPLIPSDTNQFGVYYIRGPW
jgi:hypothetical protein